MAQPITQPTARFSLGKLLTLVVMAAVVAGMFKLVVWPITLFAIGVVDAFVAAYGWRKDREALSHLSLITSCLIIITLASTDYGVSRPNGQVSIAWPPAVAACATQFLAAVVWLLGNSRRSESDATASR